VCLVASSARGTTDAVDEVAAVRLREWCLAAAAATDATRWYQSSDKDTPTMTGMVTGRSVSR